MRGVERTSIRHQLVRRRERRRVMVSSDENNGWAEVRGKSGFIDLNRDHMASWSVESFDTITYDMDGLGTLYMVFNRVPKQFLFEYAVHKLPTLSI